MSKLLERLNVVSILLLCTVMASVLLAQVRPQPRPAKQDPEMIRRELETMKEWTWPETLQVNPWRAGDPVEIVRIAKGVAGIYPGEYRIPGIAGDMFQNRDALSGWLGDMSLTLRSRASKAIVSLGIGVVLPVRRTDGTCFYAGEDQTGPWCVEHPHWCDGGCPSLVFNTLHWGLVPKAAAEGLEGRFRSEARGLFGDRTLLQGTGRFWLPPGQEITLSRDGRVDGFESGGDPRGEFTGTGFLLVEGIEEASSEAPCRDRGNWRTGCAFAEVPKFNIGINIVYFEDGTIWGNYGYGYALPNPDGIFTRVGAQDIPGVVNPGSAPK